MPRVTISEPGKTPQPYRFKLERKIVKIGRSSESDIVIECGSASTNHCTMERVEGGYILRDNDSTNGIKQDDTLMSIIDLFDGMEVLVGDVPMKFQLSESEIESLSEEEFSTHQKKKLPPSKDDAQRRRPPRSTTAISRPAHMHRPPPAVQSSPGPFSFLMVFILMIVAIFAGMAIRHYKETGNFLLSRATNEAEQTAPAKTADENGEAKDGDATAPSE